MKGAAVASRWTTCRRFRVALRTCCIAAASVGLAACAGPPPAEYVLGAAPPSKAVTVPQTGLPVVEVKRVRLPDYLDTTDLLIGSGDKVTPSPTGRWGERLSVGITRALVASLSVRLPNVAVSSSLMAERPTRQVLVDVTTFEAGTDRQVILTSRWLITDGIGSKTLVAQQTTLVETAAGGDDGSVVAAMSKGVADLADLIAGELSLSLARP